ncbi:MAG: CHAT domain-containing protein [Bacteroidetes bacterium]|nr:CHAT domain-containing protein [Bacteroidota bacterium]
MKSTFFLLKLLALLGFFIWSEISAFGQSNYYRKGLFFADKAGMPDVLGEKNDANRPIRETDIVSLMDSSVKYFQLYLKGNPDTERKYVAREGLADAQFYLAKVSQKKRKLGDAMRRYRQSDSLYSLLSIPNKIYESSLNMARLNLEIGDFEVARIYARHARLVAGTIAKKSEIMGILAQIDEGMGKPEDALPRRMTQLRLVQDSLKGENEAEILNHIGNILRDSYQLDSALKYHQRAVKKQREARNSAGLAYSYYYLGRLYLTREMKDSASYFLIMSQKLHRAVRNYTGLASSRMQLGELYAQRGEYQQAINHYKDAGKIFEQENMVIEMVLSWGHIGAIFRRLGRTHEALQYLDHSVTALEKQFRHYLGENSKQTLIRRTFFIYEHAILAALELNQRNKAYFYLQSARSRTLNEILAETKLDRTLIPKELLKREKEIRDSMNYISLEIVANQDLKAEKNLEKAKAGLLEDLKLLKTEIREKVPSYNRVVSPKIVEIPKVQTTLDKKEVLVDFFIGEEAALAFVISPENLEVVSLGAPRLINRAMDDFRTDFIQRCTNAYEDNIFHQTGINERFFRTTRKLNQLIWEDIEQIPWVRKQDLILIPDGPLHYLPFELLISDRQLQPFDKYNYLVTRHEVTYVPSATTLFMSRENTREREEDYQFDFLGFADPLFNGDSRIHHSLRNREGAIIPDENHSDSRLAPLTNTAYEVEEIANFFQPKYSQLFLRENATEDTLKSLDLNQYRYIHFSSHAMINTENPELSYIALTQDSDPKEDGKLEMFEIFDLDMSPELVILSACGTGLGKLVKGEGMIGFTRSLLSSGTPTVILSLWSVADKSTSELLIGYYYYLLKGGQMDKYKGLRKAQLRMINSQTVYSNPYFWAPFVMIGER